MERSVCTFSRLWFLSNAIGKAPDLRNYLRHGATRNTEITMDFTLCILPSLHLNRGGGLPAVCQAAVHGFSSSSQREGCTIHFTTASHFSGRLHSSPGLRLAADALFLQGPTAPVRPIPTHEDGFGAHLSFVRLPTSQSGRTWRGSSTLLTKSTPLMSRLVSLVNATMCPAAVWRPRPREAPRTGPSS